MGSEVHAPLLPALSHAAYARARRRSSFGGAVADALDVDTRPAGHGPSLDAVALPCPIRRGGSAREAWLAVVAPLAGADEVVGLGPGVLQPGGLWRLDSWRPDKSAIRASSSGHVSPGVNGPQQGSLR